MTVVYLATHESQNFKGDTPKKGQLKIWNIQTIDFYKQLVYIGVIEPSESRSGLV